MHQLNTFWKNIIRDQNHTYSRLFDGLHSFLLRREAHSSIWPEDPLVHKSFCQKFPGQHQIRLWIHIGQWDSKCANQDGHSQHIWPFVWSFEMDPDPCQPFHLRWFAMQDGAYFLVLINWLQIQCWDSDPKDLLSGIFPKKEDWVSCLRDMEFIYLGLPVETISIWGIFGPNPPWPTPSCNPNETGV